MDLQHPATQGALGNQLSAQSVQQTYLGEHLKTREAREEHELRVWAVERALGASDTANPERVTAYAATLLAWVKGEGDGGQKSNG